MDPIEFVVKRTGAIVPFSKDRITNAIYRASIAVGERDRTIAEQLSAQVISILEEHHLPQHIPTVEEIQDIVEKVLIHNGHASVAKAYILYRDERARRRKERLSLSARPIENIPWAKLWHILDWSVDHGVNTLEGLNHRIQKGEFADLVQESETAYEEDVGNAASLLSKRAGEIKIVIITGPSSSGKTTTTIRLSQRLERMGMKFKPLLVDNYFLDLEQHPKDEFGDYDFETPQALDLGLINRHLHQLLAGEEVFIPFYNFKTGKRTDNQTSMKLEDGEVLLIDSLHGLFPDLTEGIGDDVKFKLYLEPLLQMKSPIGEYIHWADIRLIRRMLRDAAHRAYNPRKTLEHWHYVRTSEMHNIIPHIIRSDYIINTGMPYEVAIYRARMYNQFVEWEKHYRDDALHQDAYKRVTRGLTWMHWVNPYEDESVIPEDSVVREFIGGSIYQPA